MVTLMLQAAVRAKDSRTAPSWPGHRTARHDAQAGVGNQARLWRLAAASPPWHGKADIGADDGTLEREAEAAADLAMRMTSPAAPALLPAVAGKPQVSRNEFPDAVHDVLETTARALDQPVRGFMESRFGRDFSDVRIHDDDRAASSAQAIGARAYTVGTEVVFARGAYAPSSNTGRRLLAHELAHVVQQEQSGTRGIQRQASEEAAAGDANVAATAQAASGQAKKPARPSTAAFWQAYQEIGYNRWKTEGELHEVWHFIGGQVGKQFDNQNSCAARVSYGLNNTGAAIPLFSDKSFFNSSGTTFQGRIGDDKAYIVGAPAMEAYLTKLMGTPDATLTTGKEVTDFATTLPADQSAVFAGDHHAGLIKTGYSDPYVTTSGVLPVSAWKLPA